jgi:putative inorganic carbon (HCO3(-)) transporter
MVLIDLRRKPSIAYLVVGLAGLLAVAIFFAVEGLPQDSRTALIVAIAPLFFIALALKDARRVMLVLMAVSLCFSARYRPLAGFHEGGAELSIAPIDFPLLGLVLLGLPDIVKGLWTRIKVLYRPLTLALGFFALAHLVSIAVASDRWLASLEFLRLLKMYVLVLVLVWYLRSRQDVRLVLQVILVTVVAQGVLAIGQWATQSSFGLGFLGEASFWSVLYGTTAIGRSGGTMGHPNALAHFFEMLTPIALAYVFVQTSRRLKALAIVAVAVGVVGTFLTFSRAGWAAILIGLVLVLVFQARRRVPVAKILAVLLVLALVTGVMAIAFESLVALRLNDYGGTSWTFRFVTYGTALAVMKANPIFGVGANNYDVAVAKYIPPGLPRYRVEQASGIVHNVLLLYGAETGIVGLLSFLGVLLAVALLAQRVIRSGNPVLMPATAGILAGILALLAHGQLSWLFRYDPVFTIFWFLVGVLASIDQQSKMEDEGLSGRDRDTQAAAA